MKRKRGGGERSAFVKRDAVSSVVRQTLADIAARMWGEDGPMVEQPPPPLVVAEPSWLERYYRQFPGLSPKKRPSAEEDPQP